MAQKHILADDYDATTKLIEAHIQSGNLNFLIGSGASRPALQLAGSIETEINDLLKEGKIDAADLKALEFIQTLEVVNQNVVAGKSSPDIDVTLKNYSDFLQTTDQLLFERKTQLLPRQANLFTTNYDFFFERSASDLSTVHLNDGFDRTAIAAEGFPFRPEIYFDRTFRSGNVYARHSEIPSLNLIKIHGSLTWTRDGSDHIHYTTEEHAHLTDAEKEDHEAVRHALEKRVVILPNVRKFESTLLDRVYFDLLRLYSNALEKENALLIAFGFSFADEHILDVTKRALRNPTAMLIIFAHSESNADEFMKKFEQQRNVVVISPSEGKTIEFPELNQALAQVAPSVDRKS